jgi:hypothetical protein
MMDRDKVQLRTRAIDTLANVSTTDEVVECLNSLAVQANQSVASALKAQVQVIKYITKPDLCGSSFDLFFKNLKNALVHCEDEENAYEIRAKAGLMLNNFIFFTKAKIEWELLVNRKEGERLFVQASNELAQSVCEIALLPGGTAKAVVKATAIKNLSKILFNPDEQSDNWFKKATRWMFKNSRAAEKQAEFAETLDKLADKLVKHRDIIGKNDLIAGIYENYYHELMDYHSDEWAYHYAKAGEKFKIAWQAPLGIIGIGGCLSVVVWFVRWMISLFSTTNPGWAATQWMWTGIICGGISVIVAAISIILGMVEKRKGNKILQSYHDYYTSIQAIFSE